MANRYLEVYMSPEVRAAQSHYYGKSRHIVTEGARDPLGPDEIAFIHARDSFYMATVNEDGWPYMQHRGGTRGFLRALNPGQIAFADYKGNRQLISVGNLRTNDRVALFLMDYPNRARLKISGHARVEHARERPDLLQQIAGPEARQNVERIFVIDVVAYDWNCSQHITPRYTMEEMQAFAGNGSVP